MNYLSGSKKSAFEYFSPATMTLQQLRFHIRDAKYPDRRELT